MNELMREQFITEGVLPPEQALPHFSVVPGRLRDPEGRYMSRQDWLNTFLSRLASYGAACEEQGVTPSMVEFVHLETGDNSANNLALLGGIIRKVSGLEGKKGVPATIVPLSVTALGAKTIVESYANRTNGGRYYKPRG